MANASDAQILITQRRQSAARLLEAVLGELMEARVAINSWPEPLRQLAVDKQLDPSLEAAYKALWYFEADEERHHTEMFYLDAQLELLRQMAAFLKEGRDLPPYICHAYLPEHQLCFYYPRTLWDTLCQELQQHSAAWASAWNRIWNTLPL